MSVCHSRFYAPGYYRAALFLTGRRFRNASGVTDRAEPGAYRTKPEVVISKPGLVNPKPGLVNPKPGLIEARPAFGEGGGWNFSGKKHGGLLYIYVFQPLKISFKPSARNVFFWFSGYLVMNDCFYQHSGRALQSKYPMKSVNAFVMARRRRLKEEWANWNFCLGETVKAKPLEISVIFARWMFEAFFLRLKSVYNREGHEGRSRESWHRSCYQGSIGSYR